MQQQKVSPTQESKKMTKKDAFDKLFSDVDGMKILPEAKTSHPNKDEIEHILYGEASYDTMKAILNHASIASRVSSAKSFFDIGSGIGNAVIAAALIGSFERCVGVELLKPLYEESVNFKNKLATFAPKTASKIALVNKNALDVDFSDVDFVYMNHIVKFESPIRDKLISRMLSAKPGTLFATVIGSLPSANFKNIASEKFSFSWGQATVYFSERI